MGQQLVSWFVAGHDNGPEFIAIALLRWLQTAEIDTAFIDPAKPWQNGTDESFNGKFRNVYPSSGFGIGWRPRSGSNTGGDTSTKVLT